MTRFFGGMGGSGAGSRFNSSKGSTNATSSLDRAMAGKNAGGKKASDMSADERYQALIKEKMSAQKSDLMQAKKYSHQIPGTSSQPKEMSKSTQAALELMAQKMAKREMKGMKKPKVFEIKPTHVGGAYGGFIDAKGRVWGAGNKQILKIDTKTGDMKTMGFFGRKIGKYDPKSQFCANKIQKLLEKQAVKDGYGNNNVWNGGGSGGSSDIYGSGGWGGGSKDDKGSGWW